MFGHATQEGHELGARLRSVATSAIFENSPGGGDRLVEGIAYDGGTQVNGRMRGQPLEDAQGVLVTVGPDVEEEPIGASPAMRAITGIVDRVAPTDATVLIWGESGVGKEVVSQRLYERSKRRDRPFVKVNCAALPVELLESELFGYERGAFTGAHSQKPGKFEIAHTGTIFLDEIGEMPMPIQAKLLQVLQDGQFSRLGSRQDIRVDVRAIAATNRDLARLVRAGGFREDLYYRLNVVNIHVPPLRERPEEIPLLVAHFLRLYAQRYGRPQPTLSPSAMRRFMEHTWPGNIRELENLVKRVVVLGGKEWPDEHAVFEAHVTRSEPMVARTTLPVASPPVPAPAPRSTSSTLPVFDETLGLKEISRKAARDAERQALLAVLQRVHWHRADAARILKVSYKTLLNRIRDLKLEN
jgi:two-component system response regulator AtoC